AIAGSWRKTWTMAQSLPRGLARGRRARGREVPRSRLGSCRTVSTGRAGGHLHGDSSRAVRRHVGSPRPRHPGIDVAVLSPVEIVFLPCATVTHDRLDDVPSIFVLDTELIRLAKSFAFTLRDGGIRIVRGIDIPLL